MLVNFNFILRLVAFMATAVSAAQHHVDEKHPRQLLEVMAALWIRKDLCDVSLIVSDREINAHKVVLSAASPYFRAMFTGEMFESKQPRVVIRDVTYEAMVMLVNYAYTATVDITEESVQALLPAACLLQLNGVVSVCCEFLIRQLDATNCLGFSDFAERHNCRELQGAADKYALQHFQTVAEGEEFLMLPSDHLARLLASDELNVEPEEQVWELTMLWAKHDIPNRRQHLAVVMQNVRFCQFSAKFLVNRVSSEPLMKSNEICRDLIDEAKNSHLLPDYRCQLRTAQIQPRKPVRDSQVMYAVGGWCSGDAINTVERFDSVNNEWCVVAAMAKRRCGVGVTVLNNCVYALGGHDGASYLNSIERYDPRTNQWYSDVAPTSTCRTSVGVTVLKNMVYAVGGQDGVSCLNIVEKYDPEKNKWQRVAPMCARRLGVAVAVVNDMLYAVGGSDGTSPLGTVERYDPATNKWTLCAPMGSRRKHLGVAVLGNCLYAAGGRDDSSELNTVERYDPSTNQWYPVASMMSRRSGVGLAAVNGKLFGVGGFDGSTYLKSIEWLDVKANQWRPSAPMNYRRLGGGVGVVDTMSVPTA